jgi:hypothetical protein
MFYNRATSIVALELAGELGCDPGRRVGKGVVCLGKEAKRFFVDMIIPFMW